MSKKEIKRTVLGIFLSALIYVVTIFASVILITFIISMFFHVDNSNRREIISYLIIPGIVIAFYVQIKFINVFFPIGKPEDIAKLVLGVLQIAVAVLYIVLMIIKHNFSDSLIEKAVAFLLCGVITTAQR